MIRLVLFDIDGTLIRTEGAGQRAFAKVCGDLFSVPDGVAGMQFAGRTDTAIIRDFFKAHNIEASDENFNRFIEAYLIRLKTTLEPGMGTVLPGIDRWLAFLKERTSEVVTGLLTGNVREGARIKLSHYGIWDPFKMGAYGDDHEDRNQVAVVALERGRAMLDESLRGDEIIVVGDTPSDVACGKAIGAKVLAVATGKYSCDDLQPHKPDWLATDLERLSPETVLTS